VVRTVLRRGDVGTDVLRWQQRLSAGGYWLGTPDGSFGLLTEQATYAVQKAAGLSRDGAAGPATMRALAAGERPRPRRCGGRFVEDDPARQLLLLVQDGHLEWVLNTSTGSGATYAFEGHTYLAVTPRGHYHVYGEIDGLRRSRLGLLWRPKYFNGGIALHGATAIPPWPASHGCVRLSYPAIDWIWDSGLAPLGTDVWVR
jgi:hypothetical protein